MGDYRELKVYEKAYEGAKKIYQEIVPGFPKEEAYGLSSQIKRAAISIALNIAEGYGKGESTKELLRYMYMARGSVNEVLVLLEFAKDIGYIRVEEQRGASEAYEEIGRMLTGFIKASKKGVLIAIL